MGYLHDTTNASERGRGVAQSPQRRAEREPARPTIDDFAVASTAPPVQLLAFNRTVAAAHEAIAVANHEIYGDPLPPRLAVQAKGRAEGEDPVWVRHAAAEGVAGGGGELPHLERIQEAFGGHDVTGIQAHTGGAATQASEAIGAEAYATGDRVAFRSQPTLHTAAHEAAHVVQQRGGVQLKGGVGAVGDAYERHADAVADAVVAGRSAEALLDRFAGAGPLASGSVAEGSRALAPHGSIQMKKPDDAIEIKRKSSAGGVSTSKTTGSDGSSKSSVEAKHGAVLPALGAVLSPERLNALTKRIDDALKKVTFPPRNFTVGPVPCYVKVSPFLKLGLEKEQANESVGVKATVSVGEKLTVGVGFSDKGLEAGALFADLALTGAASAKVSYDSGTERFSGEALKLSIKASGTIGVGRFLVGGVGFAGFTAEFGSAELYVVPFEKFDGSSPGMVELGKAFGTIEALCKEHEDAIAFAYACYKYGPGLPSTIGDAISEEGAKAIAGIVDMCGGDNQYAKDLNREIKSRNAAEKKWSQHKKQTWDKVAGFYDKEEYNRCYQLFLEGLVGGEKYDAYRDAEAAALSKAKVKKAEAAKTAREAGETKRHEEAEDAEQKKVDRDILREISVHNTLVREFQEEMQEDLATRASFASAPSPDAEGKSKPHADVHPLKIYNAVLRDGVRELTRMLDEHIEKVIGLALADPKTSDEYRNYRLGRDSKDEARKLAVEAVGDYKSFEARVKNGEPPSKDEDDGATDAGGGIVIY